MSIIIYAGRREYQEVILMFIEDEKFYKIVYSMRSALSDIYGMAERMYESETEEDQKIMLDEIKKFVIEFPEFQQPEYESEMFVGDMSNLRMRSTRALVIDGSDKSNYRMKRVLEGFGVKADVAVNGGEAIDMYKHNMYDIVFIDYSMPDMDGIDAAKCIRGVERGREQLIVGLAVNTISEFKEGLNALGIELILQKPVKREQVGLILSKEIPNKVLIDFTSEF